MFLKTWFVANPKNETAWVAVLQDMRPTSDLHYTMSIKVLNWAVWTLRFANLEGGGEQRDAESKWGRIRTRLEGYTENHGFVEWWLTRANDLQQTLHPRSFVLAEDHIEGQGVKRNQQWWKQIRVIWNLAYIIFTKSYIKTRSCYKTGPWQWISPHSILDVQIEGGLISWMRWIRVAKKWLNSQKLSNRRRRVKRETNNNSLRDGRLNCHLENSRKPYPANYPSLVAPLLNRAKTRSIKLITTPLLGAGYLYDFA